MLLACMQGTFFIKRRKFKELGVVNHVQLIILHFPLLQLNLKMNSTSLRTRSLCIHTLFSQLLIRYEPLLQ